MMQASIASSSASPSNWYTDTSKIDNCIDYPQLWELFSSPVLLPANYSDDSIIEGLIRMDTFILALSAYKRRYLGINKGRSLVLNLDMPITPAAKLWLDSHVLTSVLSKSNLPASTKRGGEFIMFESNVKKKMNKRLQSIPNRYIGHLKNMYPMVEKLYFKIDESYATVFKTTWNFFGQFPKYKENLPFNPETDDLIAITSSDEVYKLKFKFTSFFTFNKIYTV
ncbi:hypothetical protein EDC94DRAFT_655399 [Helicostylum pulchrum]|nr:hypothetical protein EDC94DRAFT_655399 [Helicostylum pulchrum]